MAPSLAETRLHSLLVRAASAVVLAPPVLLAIWSGGLWFDLMMAVGCAIMVWEWRNMTARTTPLAVGLVTGLAVVGAVVAVHQAGWDAALGILLAGFVVLGGVAMALRGTVGTGWLVAAVPYLGLPAVAMVWMRGHEAGLETMIWLFASVWATDIGAYAAGITIGGPKLAPAISPNKTWAGLIGGMIAAAVTGAVTAHLLEGPWMVLAVAGAGLAVVAQAGDFFESWAKRRFGVKDSSRIIPGHGGLLDRVDGLLTAAAAAGLLSLFNEGGILTWL